MKTFLQYISESVLTKRDTKSIEKFCAGKGGSCLHIGGEKIATRLPDKKSHHQKWHFQLHPGGEKAIAAHKAITHRLKTNIRQKKPGHAFSKQRGRGKFPAVNKSWSLVKLPLKEELSMDDFVSFASDHLKLKDQPKVKFVQEKEPDMSSACYDPNDKSMKIISKGRRFMDIARSVAHEMVHQQQHERIGDPSKLDGSTGSSHEDEANAVAGRIIRMYGKKKPELYTESLSAEMDKEKDPLKFMLNTIKSQRKGSVDIKDDPKKRGAASARELMAAWYRRKSRKKK